MGEKKRHFHKSPSFFNFSLFSYFHHHISYAKKLKHLYLFIQDHKTHTLKNPINRQKRNRSYPVNASILPRSILEQQQQKVIIKKKTQVASPSQSKIKVSTESMSSSAFLRGCAEARAVKLSILDLLEVFLVFHERQGRLERGFGAEKERLWLRPKNLEALKKKKKEFDGFAETAETEREAVAVLLSISVWVCFCLCFSFCLSKDVCVWVFFSMLVV